MGTSNTARPSEAQVTTGDNLGSQPASDEAGGI